MNFSVTEKDFERLRIESLNWYVLEYDHKLAIDLSLLALRFLIYNQEKSWIELKEKFDKYIEKDEVYTSMNEDEKRSYYSLVFEKEGQTIKTLKRYQRNATCLTIFSIFEGRLKLLCEEIERENEFKIKVADLAGGDDLLRYWNYLLKVYEIDAQKVEPFFTPIKIQKLVRNIIAHQEGLVTKDQEKKITKVNGLIVNHQIEIEPAFLFYLLDKMKNFFRELLNAIDQKYSIIKATKSERS